MRNLPPHLWLYYFQQISYPFLYQSQGSKFSYSQAVRYQSMQLGTRAVSLLSGAVGASINLEGRGPRSRLGPPVEIRGESLLQSEENKLATGTTWAYIKLTGDKLSILIVNLHLACGKNANAAHKHIYGSNKITPLQKCLQTWNLNFY